MPQPTPAYPIIKIRAFILSSWVDLTPDVLANSISGFRGTTGNGPQDKIARPGRLNFALRNDAGNSALTAAYYSPGHKDAMAGWDTGLEIEFSLSYAGFETVKMRAWIQEEGIRIAPGRYGIRQVFVSCRDWMQQAADHELSDIEVVTNKRSNELADIVLAATPIQPLNTDFFTGQAIFPTGFDTMRGRTRALKELSKIAFSEFAPLYIRQDYKNGETLVLESRFTRSNKRLETEVPLPVEDSGLLEIEGGGYYLLPEGGRIILNETSNAIMGRLSLMDSPDVSRGQHVYNYVDVVIYPKQVISDTTLFSLQDPIEIKTGESIPGMKFIFRDPTGGNARVSGQDIDDLIAGTTIKMNSAEDGSGEDLSSKLSFTLSKSAGFIMIDFLNNANITAYIWFMTIKGIGIFSYDKASIIRKDQDSIDVKGPKNLRIDMPYQSSANTGVGAGDFLLTEFLNPKTRARSYKYIANYSASNLLAFMFLDLGDIYFASEPDIAGVASEYFINGISFRIIGLDVIEFTWYVSEVGDSVHWVLSSSILSSTTTLAW